MKPHVSPNLFFAAGPILGFLTPTWCKPSSTAKEWLVSIKTEQMKTTWMILLMEEIRQTSYQQTIVSETIPIY